MTRQEYPGESENSFFPFWCGFTSKLMSLFFILPLMITRFLFSSVHVGFFLFYIVFFFLCNKETARAVLLSLNYISLGSVFFSIYFSSSFSSHDGPIQLCATAIAKFQVTSSRISVKVKTKGKLPDRMRKPYILAVWMMHGLFFVSLCIRGALLIER